MTQRSLAKVSAIPVARTPCCDKKKASQQFVLKNFPDQVMHFFTSNQDVLNGGGYCAASEQTVRLVMKRSRPSVLYIGPNCQPFCFYRANSEVIPEDHPDFWTTFGRDGSGSAVEIIEKFKPDTLIFEQVPGFVSRRAKATALTFSEKLALEVMSVTDVINGEKVQLYKDMRVVSLRASVAQKDLDRDRLS